MDDYKIALGALLDANAKGDINKQLNAIKDLSVTISKATLSNDVINDIKRQLTQNGIDLKLVFGNTGQITNQAKQVGQQIGQQVQNGINSVIQKGDFKQSFLFSADKKNNVAKDAQAYFRNITNGVVSVQEKMEELDGDSSLKGFIVNIKNAKGEVESLRYSLRNITDNQGNVTGQKFQYTGGSINDASAIKQIKDIENAFSDYTAKLSQFKSTNSEILSGLTTPLSDFETKLAGLKNGTSTIDEVTNAYKSLNAEASNITKNFSRQLSPIDSAIRNLAKGEETISGLRAEFKGLNNAPKEINTELNKCARLLENVKKIESQEGRTENWSQAYRQWSDSVDTLQVKLKTLRKEQSNVASTQIFNTSDLKNNNIAYMSKVYNTIEKQMVEINRLAKAKDWQIVDVSGVEQADGKIKKLTLTVRDAEGALKKLDMQREKLQGNGKAQYGLMQVGDVKVLETASQAMDQLAEKANKIQLSTDFTKLTTDYQKFGIVSQEVENNLKELRLAQEAVINAKGTDRLATEIEKYDTALAKAKSSWKELSATQVSLSQRTSQMTSMQEWMRKNGAATKDCKDKVRQLIAECNTCDKVRFEGIKNEFKELTVQMGKAGKLGSGFLEGLVAQGKKFVQWIGVTGLVMEGVQSLRQMKDAVIEVNSAMIELRKVSDASDNEIKNYFDEAAESAKKLGASISDVINATADFSRLGYNLKDASVLAEIATLYKNVGDGITIDEASSSIVSTMKAFGIEAENAMQIIDAFNEVDILAS